MGMKVEGLHVIVGWSVGTRGGFCWGETTVLRCAATAPRRVLSAVR